MYLRCENRPSLCAEFLYTPLVNTAEGPLLERTLLTVDNLWHYGIKGIFVNIGVYIGISCGGQASTLPLGCPLSPGCSRFLPVGMPPH